MTIVYKMLFKNAKIRHSLGQRNSIECKKCDDDLRFIEFNSTTKLPRIYPESQKGH